MHAQVGHVLQFFSYNHLPKPLQLISKPFHDLAMDISSRFQYSPETTIALRKLLEAKDAAVRACVDYNDRGSKT